MKDYFIRCAQSDKPELYRLAEALGQVTYNPETQTYSGPGWVDIGQIYRETGETVTDAETVQPIALTAPVTAPDGQPYYHANLRTSDDLRALAESRGIPVADLGRFFVVDEEGNPTAPKQPAVVFA